MYILCVVETETETAKHAHNIREIMKVSIHAPILLLQLLAGGRRANGVRVRGGGGGDGVATLVDGDDADSADAADAAHRDPRLRRQASRAAPSSRLLQQEADDSDGDGHRLHEHLNADVGESGHHLSSDVFEGDIVVTYDDVAANYGVDLADQLADDGFVFANSSSFPVEGSAVADAGGGGGRGGSGIALDERLRRLGLTGEAYRTWNLPAYRRSDGKLQIPYAVNTTSPHLQGETLDTIHLALETIANSSGIVTFVPRLSTDTSYIYFVYLVNSCAANLGRNPYGPTHVYLGWCTSAEHKGEMVHEILHGLGFWHEQSRPDRDEYVSILTENIQPFAVNNFVKQDHTKVNSLGSQYDYNSIMHYPNWAFQMSAGLVTIVPTRPLQRWEAMGQCGRMSPTDIQQMRLMYQCSTGSRSLSSITADNLCTTSCKCWAYANGTCTTDDDCMGDLICGVPPAIIPKGEEYYDQLPPHTSSSLPTCHTSCHSSCCHLDHNVMMCPQTCDTPPPEVAQGSLPRRMCLPPTGGGGVVDPAATTTPTVSTASPTKAPTGVVRERYRECRGYFRPLSH